MIKNWKIVECSFCHKKELMTKEADMHSSWWALPRDWKQVNRRTHFCQYCSEAIQDARTKVLLDSVKHKDEETEK